MYSHEHTLYDASVSPEQKLMQFYLSNAGNQYGYVGDIEPDKSYTQDQISRVSLGRGKDTMYGNINDLDPDKYRDDQANTSHSVVVPMNLMAGLMILTHLYTLQYICFAYLWGVGQMRCMKT